MASLDQLLWEIGMARQQYLDEVGKLTEEQAQWRPSPTEWGAVELTEHLYWAEHGGIWGMWRALRAHQAGHPIWEGELIHKGLPIEAIIARTWQPKEQVPPIAAPRMGGPIAFWRSALASLQQPLGELATALAEEDHEAIIHPHPLSGPLDVRQRFEFLRFHIHRHQQQLLALRLG